MLGEWRPFLGRKTELEKANGLRIEAAFSEIGKSDRPPLLRMPKLVRVVLGCKVLDQVQPFSEMSGFLLSWVQFLFLDLDLVSLGQPPECLRVGHGLEFHEKTHGTASFSGTETLEDLLGR